MKHDELVVSGTCLWCFKSCMMLQLPNHGRSKHHDAYPKASEAMSLHLSLVICRSIEQC